jgi:hypothetical protein
MTIQAYKIFESVDDVDGWNALVGGDGFHLDCEFQVNIDENECKLSKDCMKIRYSLHCSGSRSYLTLGYDSDDGKQFIKLICVRIAGLDLLDSFDRAVKKLMDADPINLYLPVSAGVEFIKMHPKAFELIRSGGVTKLERMLKNIH